MDEPITRAFTNFSLIASILQSNLIINLLSLILQYLSRRSRKLLLLLDRNIRHIPFKLKSNHIQVKKLKSYMKEIRFKITYKGNNIFQK